MKRSTDRILTTHVGSLIRPQALQDILRANFEFARRITHRGRSVAAAAGLMEHQRAVDFGQALDQRVGGGC